MYPDWSVRNVNNVAVICIDGNDYVEIPDTIETIPSTYPDQIKNQILETAENGNIKVMLGINRSIVNEVGNTTRSMSAPPQTVWLCPYKL